MRLLHIMRSVNPEGGGPIEALVQSDPIWLGLGHRREIVSLDTPDDPWVPACPILTHPMGSGMVKRLQRQLPWLRYGYSPALVPWLRTHVADYDTIVVNGLWNYADLAARRVLPFQAKPYFVFTHGMLDPWFRRTYPHKHCAKQLFWWLAEGPLLHGARSVLFTSEGERQCADRAFWPYRFAHRVSGYGAADPPQASSAHALAFRNQVPALNERQYLLFLSRLHPKKGCDLLLRAFAAIAAANPLLDLVMAGPDVCDYLRTLKLLARELKIEKRVHWPGMVRDDVKWGALYGCTAFALPSHGENFGIAVVEAMACAKPVLLSDRINIASDIEAAGAGLVRTDTTAGTLALLQHFLSLPNAEQSAMGERARRCFLQKFLIDNVAQNALAILSGGDVAAQATRLSGAAVGDLPNGSHGFSSAQA